MCKQSPKYLAASPSSKDGNKVFSVEMETEMELELVGSDFETRCFPYLVLHPRKAPPKPRQRDECAREALQYDLERFPRRVVLCREESGGWRKYLLVASLARLIDRVRQHRISGVPLHDYIIAEGNTPIFLYIDIDVSRRLAPTYWQRHADALVDTVRAVLCATLSELTGLSIQRWARRWATFASLPQPAHKISYHLHADLALRNTDALREWMAAAVARWRCAMSVGHLVLGRGLLFANDGDVPVIDLSVFTQDRNFRLAFASKADSDSVMTPVSCTQWSDDGDEPRGGGDDLTSAVLASTVLCRNARPFWSSRTVRYPEMMEWRDDLGPSVAVDAPEPEFRTLPTLDAVCELERCELPRLELLGVVSREVARRALDNYRATMLADRRGTDPELDDVIVDFAAQSGRALVATLLCYGAVAAPGTPVDVLDLLAAAHHVVAAGSPEALLVQCYRVVVAPAPVDDELLAWLPKAPAPTTIVDAFALARMAITRHLSCEERVTEQQWLAAMTRAWEDRVGAPVPVPVVRSAAAAAAGDPNFLNLDAISIGEGRSKFWRAPRNDLQ